MLGSKTTNFFLGPNITFLTLLTLVYVPHSSFHPWILKKFCFGRILYCDFCEGDSEIGTLRNFSLVTARGRESRDSLFGSKQRGSHLILSFQLICPIFLKDQIRFELDIIWHYNGCNCQVSECSGEIEDLESALRNDSDWGIGVIQP